MIRYRRTERFSDSIWAPLSDTMTIVASIFLLIFFSVLVAYKTKSEQGIKRSKERIENLEKIKENKMVTAIMYLKRTVDNKIAEIDENRATLILKTELLFDSGSDVLKPEGEKFVVEKLAKSIESILLNKEIGEDIEIAIEGHSDCQQYLNDEYENWILSSRRAISVLKTLERASPVIKGSKRIRAIGYGDRRPSDSGDEFNKKREECCKIVKESIGIRSSAKRECVRNILSIDRRAEIRLNYSEKYLDSIYESYKNLVDEVENSVK